MKKGIICLWFGSIANIPSGWILCNGANDTPDLRDRFVIGAGSTYNPGDTGGANTHTHDFTSNPHVHSLVGGTKISIDGFAAATTTSEIATGTTNATNHLPPYHSLCYIMKL